MKSTLNSIPHSSSIDTQSFFALFQLHYREERDRSILSWHTGWVLRPIYAGAAHNQCWSTGDTHSLWSLLLFHFPCRLQSSPGLLPDLGQHWASALPTQPSCLLSSPSTRAWNKRGGGGKEIIFFYVSWKCLPCSLSPQINFHKGSTCTALPLIKQCWRVGDELHKRCPPAPLLDPKLTRHSSQPHPGAGAPPHPTANLFVLTSHSSVHSQLHPAPALPPLQSSVSQPIPSGFMAGEVGILPAPHGFMAGQLGMLPWRCLCWGAALHTAHSPVARVCQPGWPTVLEQSSFIR